MTTLLRTVTLALVLAVALTACGRVRETPTPASAPAPTATPAPAAVPTDTPAPAVAPTDTPAPAVQAESPLGQPESPLAQPESPLTTLEGKEIVANPAAPIDRAALVSLVNATTAPPPQAGMASVSAVLYSYAVNVAIGGTYAYLTPAEYLDGTPVPPAAYFGPRAEYGDVGAETNMQGQFIVDNVPPGDYYLVAQTFYDWPAAFTSPDDSLPTLVTVKAGDQLNLGLLYVNWP